jgi:hypothetical protein
MFDDDDEEDGDDPYSFTSMEELLAFDFRRQRLCLVAAYNWLMLNTGHTLVHCRMNSSTEGCILHAFCMDSYRVFDLTLGTANHNHIQSRDEYFAKNGITEFKEYNLGQVLDFAVERGPYEFWEFDDPCNIEP